MSRVRPHGDIQVTLLTIFRSGPYGTAAGQEGLDAVLAAAALDLNVSLLLQDDAVFLLKRDQHSREDCKNYTKAFAALDDFGVEKIYIDKRSLAARGLELDDLLISPLVVDDADIEGIIASANNVFVY